VVDRSDQQERPDCACTEPTRPWASVKRLSYAGAAVGASELNAGFVTRGSPGA